MDVIIESRLGPLKLKNPVLASAGPITDRYEKIIKLVNTGVGGIYTKSVCLEKKTRHFYMAELRGAFMDTEPCIHIDEWLDKVSLSEAYRHAHANDVILIIEMDAKSSSEVHEIVSRTYSHTDGYEIHLPHFKDINDLAAAVKTIKSYDKLASIKLGANDWKIIKDLIHNSIASGIDVIHINNPDFPGMALDLSTHVPLKSVTLRPIMNNVIGWITGSTTLRYYVQKNIYDIKQSYPEIDIVGSSGIRTGRDALEMLLVGASAVAICSAAILEGFDVFKRVIKELRETMIELGFSSINDVKEFLIRKPPKPLQAIYPEITKELCTNCRLCEMSCPNNAIKIVDGKARIDTSLCSICGLCYSRCRRGAIAFHMSY